MSNILLNIDDYRYLNETADLYNQKVEELDMYFRFVSVIAENNTKIYFLRNQSNRDNEFIFSETPRQPSEQTEYVIDEDIKHIHNSNLILQLYNGMEALASTIMRDIHKMLNDDFRGNNLSLSKLKLRLSKKIINHITKLDELRKRVDKHVKDNVSLEHLLIKEWLDYYDDQVIMLDKSPWFSGNVTVYNICTIGEHYHFIEDKNQELLRIPSTQKLALNNIKENRNILAHGKKSFIEKGKDMDLTEIKKYSNHIFEYFRYLINQVEEYLDKKGYLITQL